MCYFGSRMYRFRIIRVSGGKRGPEAELAERYRLRLSPYAKLEHVDLQETPFRTEADRPRVLAEEADKIRKHLVGTVIILGEHGKTFDSRTFAKKLDQWAEQGAEPVTFLIGGPLGYDRELERSAATVLSLSPLTFPHDLAHAILLEQLYRACAILTGKTYHY